MTDAPPGAPAGAPPDSPADTPTRCGFVAVIGEPNAGKSTLVNAMVGSKVSIVTHKVQTTRFRIRGMALEGASQLIFVDTPGLFRPRRRLDRAMVAAAWAGVSDADIVVLMAEAQRGISEGVEAILEGLDAHLGKGRPVALAINKIDRVRRPKLLELAAALNARRDFARTFMISALQGDGTGDLRRWLAGSVPEGPWLYPADQVADLPMRLIAAEITREKLTLRLHQELPYQATVETESWEERRDGSVRVEQIVYVARDGHKGIVLGEGGHTIRQIGTAAREELSAMLGRPVHLFLNVKARPDWQDDPARYRALGLDLPKKG
ncbi:MAG TPA: GTPase Era [Thermohalobaculum sp.]|nr:GTPase Era [Thermohalobaculum sp.]